MGNASTEGDCAGEVVSAGHNLIEDLTGCVVTGTLIGNITGVDPRLSILQDNGGPTNTHALLPGSPAIDAGDDAACAAPPVSGVDQRGIARPQGAHCDIGAL